MENLKDDVLQQLEGVEERACNHLRWKWSQLDFTGLETPREMFEKYEKEEGKLSTDVLHELLVDIIDLPLLNENFASSQPSYEEADNATSDVQSPSHTTNQEISPDLLLSRTTSSNDDIYATENIIHWEQEILDENNPLFLQVEELKLEVEELKLEVERLQAQLDKGEIDKKRVEVVLDTSEAKAKEQQKSLLKSNQKLQHVFGKLQLSESQRQADKQRYDELLAEKRKMKDRINQLTELLRSRDIRQSAAMRASWIIEPEKLELHRDKRLGRGGWGDVFEGKYYGAQVAVKQLHSLPPENRPLFKREMEIASHCHHPNVLRLIGATNDNNYPLLVTELMDCSLRDLIKDQKKLLEPDIWFLIREIVYGLRYFHEKTPPLVHRDVKTDNILLKRKGDIWEAKIADYGTANYCSDSMTPNRGTLIYAAPESRTSHKQSPQMDVYSFGLVVLEMTTGERPKRDRSVVELQLQNVSSPRLIQLINACIEMDPEKRPTMRDIADFYGLN